MTRIGLLSDTHGYLDERVIEHFASCTEIWHAGDVGDPSILEKLALPGATVRCVFGNIDEQALKSTCPENNIFVCEKVEVFMTHIGGYPPRYNPRVKPLLLQHRPQLFIAGHSHILKIMFDEKMQCLHMNPGAAGKYGWHKTRTIIRFVIDADNIRDCEVIELGKR